MGKKIAIVSTIKRNNLFIVEKIIRRFTKDATFRVRVDKDGNPVTAVDNIAIETVKKFSGKLERYRGRIKEMVDCKSTDLEYKFRDLCMLDGADMIVCFPSSSLYDGPLKIVTKTLQNQTKQSVIIVPETYKED